MTEDQFKQKLKRPEKLRDISNYIICVCLIGFSLWYIFDLMTNEFYHPELGNKKYLILIFPLIFAMIGIYGFWRIPKEYQIGSIDSSRPIDEKLVIVDEYLSQLKIRSKRVENTQIECVYRNKYLNSLVISMHLDDDKILYNVQSLDTANKGIIDLGLSKRATNRLRKFLEDRL